MNPSKAVFEWDACEADVAVTLLSEQEGVSLYRITLDYPEKRFPECIKLRWYTAFDDAYATWTPSGRFRHDLMPSWCPVDTYARSASGAPVFSLMAKGGENRTTFALSDAVHPVRLYAGMHEPSGKIQCSAELFAARSEQLAHYEVLLRVDESRRPYYEALYGVRTWWSEVGYPAAPVPQESRRAMFSSWYSFQKSVTEESLLEQCRLAKTFGLDTLILDDGWQCDETVSGYTYCGDWKAVSSKFPDMRRFIRRLHEMGMKCILWYSVPFVGMNAENFSRFSGKYLRPDNPARSVMVLDPRFPDVRAWLTETYVTALREWDLDGFKLDFVDNFFLSDESSDDYAAMDCPSPEAAVEKLLAEITAALRKIKPDIMLEFRQTYIGPVMQKYGNIFRVSDCAGAALFNRVSSLDLRLLMGDPTKGEASAVHSDMLMWDYDATPEGAADQLAACLFCTPQISVMFDRLTDSHRKMLACYLGFMDEYRDVLQGGYLMPLCPAANYTEAIAKKDGICVAALYGNHVFCALPDVKKTVIVNATGTPEVFVRTEKESAVRYTVKNCMGETVQEGSCSLTGITEFTVPHNGFLYLEG